VRALAHLRAEAAGAGVRFPVLRSAPPLSLRPTAEAVYLVGSAAGPLGGDDLGLRVEVGPGVTLTLRTVAASVVLPGRSAGRSAGSRFRVDARVAAGAVLRWLPEPLVAARDCDHQAIAHIRLEPGARLWWREEVVLGRHGERPGACRCLLRVDLDGRPLLRHELRVGAPGWDGPAVTAGARAVGQVLLVGPGPRPGSPGGPAELEPGAGAATAVRLPLDGPGTLVTAVGADAPALRAALDAATGAAQAG
jgi:urease accessory protein